MMRSRFGQTMNLHLKEHFPLYVFTTVLFMIGVIFGAIVVNSLSFAQKNDLYLYLMEFFQVMQQTETVNSQIAFQESMSYYLKYIGLIWILGLSIIGLPLILIFIFLKGLLVGFTVGFLVNQLQWDGLFFAFVSVVPQNLVVIPALIIVGVSGIAFSIRLIKTRFFQYRDKMMRHFIAYSALVLCMVFVFLIVSAFEAFVSPVLMNKVSAMITSNMN